MKAIGFAMDCMLICSRWKASVTSWGRTEKRNTSIGGVPGSYHLHWLGMDVVLDDQKKDLAFEKDCGILDITALYEGDHYHLQLK